MTYNINFNTKTQKAIHNGSNSTINLVSHKRGNSWA